mmetsp:Transcript_126785/g.316848  ORF Transcript_126785/g.316848 Transcript_126785/m.316848 type:complete len:280 (-) Transcript_126785:88-927(-)
MQATQCSTPPTSAYRPLPMLDGSSVNRARTRLIQNSTIGSPGASDRSRPTSSRSPRSRTRTNPAPQFVQETARGPPRGAPQSRRFRAPHRERRPGSHWAVSALVLRHSRVGLLGVMPSKPVVSSQRCIVPQACRRDPQSSSKNRRTSSPPRQPWELAMRRHTGWLPWTSTSWPAMAGRGLRCSTTSARARRHSSRISRRRSGAASLRPRARLRPTMPSRRNNSCAGIEDAQTPSIAVLSTGMEKLAVRALRVSGTVFSHAMLAYAWKSARGRAICRSVL